MKNKREIDIDILTFACILDKHKTFLVLREKDSYNIEEILILNEYDYNLGIDTGRQICIKIKLIEKTYQVADDFIIIGFDILKDERSAV